MTPTQQSALETLAGRAMTASEVTMAGARQDATLAASLSVGRTVQGSVTPSQFLAWSAATGLRATIEDIAAGLIPAGSSLVAGQVQALRPTALAMLDCIRSGISLDLSSSVTGQGNLQMLGAWVTQGAMTAAQEAQLVGLAKTAAPISTDQVSSVLNGA